MLFSLLFSLYLHAQEREILDTLERPTEVSEDGEFYYDTKSVKGAKKRNTKYGNAIEEEDGSFTYDTSDIDDEEKKVNPKKSYGKPKKVSGGQTFYDYERSEQHNAVTVQYLHATFEDFKDDTRSFDSVYGAADGVLVDYEWQLKTAAAKFGLVASSGVLIANGKGTLSDGSEAREKYNAYILPLFLKLRINLEFLETQYLVPYAEGGGGLIGIWERRDDGERSARAFTPAFTFAGGVAILLDWMMGDAIARLDNSDGINHMWLVGSFQVLVATDEDYDLSDQIISGGLKVDF
ncbi:MAG: hypothetical protein KDD37_11685 [Bdellovibrionales bacterium]|nr:hypothetical protein [Bdellovibrionales bacterium]